MVSLSKERIPSASFGSSMDDLKRPSVRRVAKQSSKPEAIALGYNDGSCPTGNCPPAGPVANGNCPTGNCPTGNCPTGGCPTGNCPSGCFQGKFGEYYCKRSPDYGYSPPAKYPLHRRGIEYNHYYPANWYGAGADYSQSQAPMVYQPTDTTQLGYRYQHVPFWQPMPNRLPPRPIPAQWHTTNPAVSASRFSNGNGPAGYAGGQFGGYSGYQNGSYGAANSCPPGMNSTPTMITQPGSPASAIPPAPLGTGAPASPIPQGDEYDDESGAEPRNAASNSQLNSNWGLRLFLGQVELRSICFNTEGKSIYWFSFRVISFQSAFGVGIETPSPPIFTV